jgi:hypothetical protein
MDAELHRVPDTIGEIQEALLPILTVGVDEPCSSIRSLRIPCSSASNSAPFMNAMSVKNKCSSSN